MPIETSISIIALAVVVLVIFLVATLLKTKETLESTRKDLHHLSTEAIQLMQKLDELTSDVKSKSESLNFLFRPLKGLGKEPHRKESHDTVNEVLSLVTVGLHLFEKIKTAVKHHGK